MKDDVHKLFLKMQKYNCYNCKHDNTLHCKNCDSEVLFELGDLDTKPSRFEPKEVI